MNPFIRQFGGPRFVVAALIIGTSLVLFATDPSKFGTVVLREGDQTSSDKK